MRLFEAIIDANHRALDGDNTAGLHFADFARKAGFSGVSGVTFTSRL